ncbi:MAG TPA: acyl-CoA dehydrogenase family protein, partial [Acidimicrobiales bacterium]|nr:acyl-CoA dehydrogenase family protein [Acidimicrobiales bacterium]
MFEWSEEQVMLRDAVRRFVEAEIAPNIEELEHGDTPPYDTLRKLYRTFGMDAMARAGFEQRIKRELEGGVSSGRSADEGGSGGGGDASAGFMMIPIIELSRYCPGMVTALGVSMGLAAGAIMSRGTTAQKQRWGGDLLTLDKIGSWAITEPGSGSDAFGGMLSTARRDGDEYILNGSKTFITNGPHADTIVFICKLDEGNDPRDRKILTFVLDKGMPGLEQSKPLRKMGLHSSPTGQLFLTDVRAGRDRLLGETEEQPARAGAKEPFS